MKVGVFLKSLGGGIGLILLGVVVAFLALFTAVGWVVENNKGFAIFFTVVTALLALLWIWLRLKYGRFRRDNIQKKTPLAADVSPQKYQAVASGDNYENALSEFPDLAGVTFGDPPPTLNQFIFGYRLGIKMNGLTKDTIGPLLEEMKSNKHIQRRSGSEEGLQQIYGEIVDRSPAGQDMLAELREYHVQLPRKVSNREAEAILEMLDDWQGNCPHCGHELDIIMVSMDHCVFCAKSLKSFKVPIEMD